MTDVAPGLSDDAYTAAHSRALLVAAYTQNGRNYFQEFFEEDFQELHEQILEDPLAKNGLGSWQLGRIAEMTVRMFYSDDETSKHTSQYVYDLFKERLDPHLQVYNHTIAGDLKSGAGGYPEKSIWQKGLSVLSDAAGVLELGWQYVGAPILGNTVRPFVGMLQGSGWQFNSRGELDLNADGRVTFLESTFGKNADSWWEHAIDIAGEIAFDPTSWVSFGASGAARSALRNVGRQMNIVKKGDEIADLGMNIAKKGLKGLDQKHMDNVVEFHMRGHAVNRKTITETQYGLGHLFDAEKFVTPQAVRERLAKKNIDYLSSSVDHTISKFILEGMDFREIFYALKRAEPGLTALHRSGKAGLHVAGRSVPWWHKATLSEAPLLGKVFNPQVVRLMGGPTSLAYKAAIKPFKGWRPRAELTTKHGLAVSRGMGTWMRKAFADTETSKLYPNQVSREGFQDYALGKRDFFARNANEVRMPNNETALRFTLPGLTDNKIHRRLLKMTDDKTYGDYADLEDVARNNAETAPEIEAHAQAKMDELVEQYRKEQAMKVMPKQNADAYIPLREWEERAKIDIRGDDALRIFHNQDQVQWVTSPYIRDTYDTSMLTAPRLLTDQKQIIGQASKVLAWMQHLWAASAMSISKGTVTLTTNMLGAINTAMLVGTSVPMMVKNVPRTARLWKLHHDTLKVMNAVRAIKYEFRDLVGEVKGEVTKEELVGMVNAKINTMDGASDVLDSGLTPQETIEKLQELRTKIGNFDSEELTLKETSYMYTLDKLGASTEEIIDLRSLQRLGVYGEGRTRDLLVGGLHEVITDATNRQKFETAEKILTLGAYLPHQTFEDYMRSLVFLTGKDMGMTWEDAWDLVARSQFDYQDLTRKEANFKAAVSRFYTFPRKLVGLMAEQAINEPGRLMASTRAMYDSVRYIHEVTIGEDESYVDMLLPSWIERSPGKFVVNGIVGRARFPLFEYMDLLQAGVSLPFLFTPSQNMDITSDSSLMDSREGAKNLLAQFGGLIPESFKYVVERATERDAFSGRALNKDDKWDWYMRVVGLPLPGIAQGVNYGRRIHDLKNDDDFSDRASTMRILSFIDGIWKRSLDEIDSQGQNELWRNLSEIVDEANENGVDISLISDLQAGGVVNPQTGVRYMMYGKEIERESPDFNPRVSRSVQRELLPEQDYMDRLDTGLARELNISQTDSSNFNPLQNEAFRVAQSQFILKDILNMYSEEGWAAYTARMAAGSRELQEKLGISAPPVASLSSGLTDEEEYEIAQQRAAHAGFTLDELAVAYPYLNDAEYSYRQLRSSGLTDMEVINELVTQLPERVRFMSEPGSVLPRVTGWIYTPDEINSFENNVDRSTHLLMLIKGWDYERSNLFARISLLSNSEQTWIFGAPLFNPIRIDTGIPRDVLTSMRVQQRLQGPTQ